LPPSPAARLDQPGNRLGLQERGIAVEHDDIGDIGEHRLERRTRGSDRVAGAARLILHDRPCRRNRLGDGIHAAAEHHHRLGRAERRQRRQHMAQHRPPGDLVQRLWGGRPHPGPLAGGEDDGSERRVHRRLAMTDARTGQKGCTHRAACQHTDCCRI